MAALSILFIAAGSLLWASSADSALRTPLIAVRIAERIVLLCSRRTSDCRMRFFACFVLGM